MDGVENGPVLPQQKGHTFPLTRILGNSVAFCTPEALS